MLGKKKETFLSLDIAQDGTNGLYFSIDADRRIAIEKFERHIDLVKFLQSPLRRAAHASLEGEYVFNGHRMLVAGASADIATTVPVPFSWRRDAVRETFPVTLDELDDQIGRALPKIVSQCRVEAARRFGIEAVDAVLVDAYAREFAVDGKHAAHLEGFVGKEISFVLELTFLRRDIFEPFRKIFNSPEPFFFFESPQAQLSVLHHVRPLPLNVVNARDGAGSLFVLQAEKHAKIPVLYREPFAWSFESAIDAIRDAFSVSDATAAEMYGAYARGEVSPPAARAIRELIDLPLAAFGKAIARAKVRGTTYVDMPYPLPWPPGHRERGTAVEALPLDAILETFGISFSSGAAHDDPHLLFRHLAPFLVMYFDRDRGALNDALRKRVHWLAG